MSGWWKFYELTERCKQAKGCQNGRVRLQSIEALLAVTAAILVFLGVFGSFRRRCGSRKFALVGFTAYSLLPAIIAYTLGLIQSAPFCILHFPIWVAYLVIVLGSADSYTAHSIEDIEQWKSFNVDSAAKCFMASWMIASYLTQSGKILWTVLIFVILFIKVDERARALMLASNSMMQKNSKLVFDYMSSKHDPSASCNEDPATIDPATIDPATIEPATIDPATIEPNTIDPATMCDYLVRVPKDAKVPSLCSTQICRPKRSPWKDGDHPHYRQRLHMTDGVITVDKVWKCEGRLLSVSGGDRDGRLKDLCLSFSLFKLICLRFAGYSLPQAARKNLERLIRDMLYKENGCGCERVFRLIEVELAFLFDLFYTKYPVTLNPRRLVYKLIQLAILVAVAVISLYLAIVFHEEWKWSEVELLAVLVTILLMMSLLVVEFAQFGIMIFSEWAKVTYICKYVQSKRLQNNRCAEKLIEIMCGVWLLKPWGRQLRQYSLLQSYSYSPSKCIHNKLTAAYFDTKRKGQEQIAPTNLSEQVKKAIAQSLEKYLGNGQKSLRLNNLPDALSWACNLETTTHVIMVWHIATTFCERKVPPAELSQQRDDFDVATKLSQYLAYLVAFAPRLLPGHPCRTEYVFGRAVSEARELVGGSLVSLQEMIEKLEVIDNEQCQETIVGRGARLGMQLLKVAEGGGQIWKVLADFWADMLLYVAPSNDTVAHGKYLTTGGEFVTHIWVLVSHAGITRYPRDGEEHDDPERN